MKFCFEPTRAIIANRVTDLLLYCQNIHLQGKGCWIYDKDTDTWSVYSSGNYGHGDYPGTVHKHKIYIAGDIYYPEMFDPTTKEWSTWPKPNSPHGKHSCLLAWQDSLILLGGFNSSRTVEMFQVSSQTWKSLDFSAPMEIFTSGCAVLPNEEILVLGSNNQAYRKSAFVYNVLENKWQQVEDSFYDRALTALIVLGSRVFAVGGYDNDEIVEEFIYSTRSWVTLDTTVLVGRQFHSMISVPAELFAHLPGGCTGIM